MTICVFNIHSINLRFTVIPEKNKFMGLSSGDLGAHSISSHSQAQPLRNCSCSQWLIAIMVYSIFCTDMGGTTSVTSNIQTTTGSIMHPIIQDQSKSLAFRARVRTCLIDILVISFGSNPAELKVSWLGTDNVCSRRIPPPVCISCIQHYLREP